MVKLNLPLRPWVPQWLGIVTMFVVMFPIIMLNGTYTGSMLEVSSTLGILSEDITMGYYAAAAGMAVAYPIIPKIRAIATPKTLLLTDLLLQIILSFVCAQVGNMDITIICSFFIGFLKALKEEKISVPGDVAIVGCNDDQVASFVTPGLSTVKLHNDLVGMMAAKTLMECLYTKREQGLKIIVPNQLILRESCPE